MIDPFAVLVLPRSKNWLLSCSCWFALLISSSLISAILLLLLLCCFLRSTLPLARQTNGSSGKDAGRVHCDTTTNHHDHCLGRIVVRPKSYRVCPNWSRPCELCPFDGRSKRMVDMGHFVLCGWICRRFVRWMGSPVLPSNQSFWRCPRHGNRSVQYTGFLVLVGIGIFGKWIVSTGDFDVAIARCIIALVSNVCYHCCTWIASQE